MGDGFPPERCPSSLATAAPGRASPAPTNAPDRSRSRRERAFLSDTRLPAFLVLASPLFHCFLIALNMSVFRIEMQVAFDLPRDVRKLQHGDRDVPVRNRRVQLLAFADCRDKVGKVGVGHGI